MKEMLKKKLQEKMANSEGFTLLEILVVLTIMGFLIAMVGPRLAGISGGAVDTVCDSNQNRMITYMASYFEKTSRYPNKLTNLVDEDVTASTYQIPRVSDDDPENGAETLASEFYTRNHFHIHHLSANEAAELSAMGIVTMFNLNLYGGQNEAGTAFVGGTDPDVANVLVATANRGAHMADVNVATGLGVAMVGMGVDATPAWVVSGATERGWGEPDWFGRITLGMGPESSLVTSGVVANAAHCPGGLQEADNVIYNDYNLVLPRLAATEELIDPLVAPFVGMDNDGATDGVQLNAVAYDNEPAVPYDYATNDEHLRLRVFDVSAAQEGWQYATQCPEGHAYPENNEFWGLDLDASIDIN